MFPKSFHTTRDCCRNMLNLGIKSTHVHSFTTVYTGPGHCKTAGVNEDCSSLLLMKRLARLSLLGVFWLQFRKILKHMLNSLRADVTKVNYLGINSGTNLSVLLS